MNSQLNTRDNEVNGLGLQQTEDEVVVTTSFKLSKAMIMV
jgi:hypothetical protein